MRDAFRLAVLSFLVLSASAMASDLDPNRPLKPAMPESGRSPESRAPSAALSGAASKQLTRSVNSGGVADIAPSSSKATDPASKLANESRLPGSTSRTGESNQSGEDVSGSMRMVQAPQGQAPASPLENQLQQVIVTAEKRSERVQDVPVPLTDISAATLVESNQPSLQDYYSSIPGLSVMPVGATGGQTIITIRGITTGFGNPTVGMTVDDVPIGSSYQGQGQILIDMDPSDLRAIEVLRGPQGTLYGASSMGGLIRYVTVDPSTDGVHGSFEAGTDEVYNGAGPGYDVRGAINVPLTDTTALRASVFTREDPGYIDNPVRNIHGVNETHVSGGRISALWRPSELFSLKVSSLYQDFKADGTNEVDVPTAGIPQTAGLGDLQQNYIPGAGKFDRVFQLDSAVLTAKLGTVDLTSVTGYSRSNSRQTWDWSYLVSGAIQSLFGVTGSRLDTHQWTDKFSQEVRASVPIGKKLEWLVGGFYTHELSPGTQLIPVENSVSGEVVGNFGGDVLATTFSEYAAFTDLTVKLTDRLDVQLGGRESHIEQVSKPGLYFGPLYGGGTRLNPELNSAANAFTYLLTPRFKVSPDLMVYVRLASGYRAGGANSDHLLDPLVPSAVNSDTTRNYEIGVKGDLLDRRLSFAASLYYIDWKSIQLTLLDPITENGYSANGSRAKSEGVELSIDAKPLPGLTLGAWLTYDDAALTEALPGNSTVYGIAGSKLPYSSDLSGNLSAEQAFPINSDLTGFVGGTLSYVGAREGSFVARLSRRQYYPPYAKADLHAGLQYDSWTLNAYVNNVADKRGVLGGGVGSFPSYAFDYIQPRTVGLSLTRKF